MVKRYVIVILCLVVTLASVGLLSTIYAQPSAADTTVLGRFFAISPSGEHRFESAPHPDGFIGSNVVALKHSGDTGSVAIKFEDKFGNERGAVGWQNGEEVGSTFFLTGYTYLSAGGFTPSAQPMPPGTSNGFILAQQGYYQGVYYDAIRFMCHKTTWVCYIKKPDGSPIITINPDGSVIFHGPVTFGGG